MEKLNVLYEDNHVIVVLKPHNVPTQADASGDEDMLSIVKKYIKEKQERYLIAYRIVKENKKYKKTDITVKIGIYLVIIERSLVS